MVVQDIPVNAPPTAPFSSKTLGLVAPIALFNTPPGDEVLAESVFMRESAGWDGADMVVAVV